MLDFLLGCAAIGFYGWLVVQIGVGLEKVSGVLLAVWLMFGFLILPAILLVWGITSSG